MPHGLAGLFLLTLAVCFVVAAQVREARSERDEAWKIAMVVSAYVLAIMGVLALVMV